MEGEPAARPVLITKPTVRRFDRLNAFVAAAQLRGQSVPRLAWRLYRTAKAPQLISTSEFYHLGLYRPELSGAEIAAYVGAVSNTRFNLMLNGRPEVSDAKALHDKLEAARRLTAAGIAVAGIRAVFPDSLSWDGAEVLTTAEDIVAFLMRPGSTPCFGKPIYGTKSKGVVAIEGPVGDGRLVLGNGRVIEAATLAQEIVRRYRRGYMFQDLLRASDAVRPISGPVLPVIRVYTLWLEGAPRPLFASSRLPAPTAMSDDDAIPGSVWLFLDVATGTVLRGQDIGKDAGDSATHAPVTGTPLAGFRFPDWPQVLATAVETHRCFPKHRCVGTDLAPSDQGLIVNEANGNPGHRSYQMASLQGLLNPGFRPLFRQALAERGIREPVAGVPWP
jgi:hypothetical protein